MEKGGRKEVEYSERGRKKMTGERGAEKVKRCKERRKTRRNTKRKDNKPFLKTHTFKDMKREGKKERKSGGKRPR